MCYSICHLLALLTHFDSSPIRLPLSMSRHDDCEPLDKRLSSIVFLDLSGVSAVYLYLAAAFVLVCTLLATIFFEIIINMIAQDFS